MSIESTDNALAVPAVTARKGLREWEHLGLVLWVALAAPLVASLFYAFGGEIPHTPASQALRLCAAIIAELSGLLVLRHVMATQRRSWSDIGWSPEVLDVPRAVTLLVAILIVSVLAFYVVQLGCYFLSVTLPSPKSLKPILGFGVSALSIAFVCVNPFFEELIVRAYTISELLRLGKSPAYAVAVSVIAQVSCHLYQGFTRALVVGICFTVMSVYYVRTRRIVPVILVHLGLDVFGLLSGGI